MPMTPACVDPYAPETVAVYQLYGSKGELLYVGQSSNPKLRFYKHSKDSDWWPEVAYWKVDWWPERYSARAEEARLITERHPLYNTVYVPIVARSSRPRPPGRLADIREAMHGERCVRTMVVLGRLAGQDSDLYGWWTAGDLRAFVASFGFDVRKRMSGHRCLVLEEVETALEEAGRDASSSDVSAGQPEDAVLPPRSR